MLSTLSTKKKGRKPKVQDTKKNTTINDKVDSDQENIIYHLQLTMSDINESNNTSNIFLKSQDSQDDFHNNVDIVSSVIDNININKIDTHVITFKENTRCWWCHHTFDNEPIQLPEDCIGKTFSCIGNFCSFPCVKAYNLNIHDTNVQKRDTLINILYYNMYNVITPILPAPHWTTLNEYGGILSIEEFRKASKNYEKSYIVLKPPIISRQMQIEESYRVDKFKEVSMNQVSKLYLDMDNTMDYTIKRTKKLPTSDLNLESTIGLRRVSL
jgi:hypothetical protein